MGGGSMCSHLPKAFSNVLSPSSSSSSMPPQNFDSIFPASANYSSTSRKPFISRSCSTCQVPVNGGRAGVVQSSRPSMLGTVPSPTEVEWAIAVLQRFLSGISSTGSNINWVRLLGSCDREINISAGLGRVIHAFHMLQAVPSFKRLVISLSSDRAIWEAILNNEAVWNLQESLKSESGISGISAGAGAGAKPHSGLDIFGWFLEILKEKIDELLEKFRSLVDEIFKQQSDRMKATTAGTATASFQEEVRSSLLLSVVILLIVVLARNCGV
ncbi:hypothetical protein SAY87_013408 [Trapa incisa]|uniref:Uncharacterized protein n=1 Tax=Trapa incisa TaxID=236973 RepID=A0AAN7QG21_9MYRT|nr:hypothetical protein SAY87_013408 [Trapa incisa]